MQNTDFSPFTLDGVYYLESQNPHMNPIAIRPGVSLPDYVYWEDTSHGRILHFSQILFDGQKLESKPAVLPDCIQMTDLKGEIYKLVKLTTAIFNEKLKGRVACGERLNFETDQALQDHYLRTDFETVG